MHLIDELHCNGIGVILDWVPAHFPKDAFSLARFDGSCLYEHEDPRQGCHPQWGTYIFNYGRNEVRNFLISSGLFWLECYHVDGIRVDAVASMLYLDYGKQSGGWIPNKYGGHENLEAVSFLRDFNSAVIKECPGCFTCAEESTSWAHVTGPVEEGGLGFTFKWNMGWMHDTLKFMSDDPIYRRYSYNKLTFGMLYQYSENFILPFSHDEVVYGKRSLLNKMPGDDWQRYAN
ncbi:TPA: 1,4-alpha-glucan branching enzyme, partial [bacterium UBP9_UBA11836]|nr:1,4-alpha-glucan branching enzyme [bacterium UBP9_UBA11836]